MKTFYRFNALLALLIMGSATARAQTGDSFPEVNDSKYAESMTIIGKVRMGGAILGNETVIAVYQDDEIRGKDTPFDQNGKRNIFSINVFGDTNGEQLHFKVLTKGRLIEVDQGLTYKVNDIIGTPQQPYYIDLPGPVYTTTDTDGWGTTYVPFNAEIPDGVTAYVVTNIVDDKLQLEKIEGNILPANTPVIIQTDGTESFEWLSRVADANEPSKNLLAGTDEVDIIDEGSVLVLGLGGEDGETPGFWRNTGTELPPNTAYIANPADGVEGYPLTDLYDAIRTVKSEKVATTYDLQGREIRSDSAKRKGIYIRDGKKIVIK